MEVILPCSWLMWKRTVHFTLKNKRLKLIKGFCNDIYLFFGLCCFQILPNGSAVPLILRVIICHFNCKDYISIFRGYQNHTYTILYSFITPTAPPSLHWNLIFAIFGHQEVVAWDLWDLTPQKRCFLIREPLDTMGFGVAVPQKMKHKSCAKGADGIFKTKKCCRK